MHVIEGRTATVITKIVNIVLLNILWLIVSLPVITIVPATAAMAGVVRDWRMKGDDGVFRPFFRLFQENMKQGLFVGIPWLAIGTVLVLDLSIFVQRDYTGKLAFLSITTFALFLYLFTSAFLIPVMLFYNLRGLKLIKQAFVISFSDIGTSVAIVVITLASIILVIFVPITVFFIFSLAAMVNYRFCLHAFRKLAVPI